MKKSTPTIKELTYISVAVATMIVGGFTIVQLSMVLPIPGVKYILMSPYLSMVIYILLSKVRQTYALLKFGVIFGGVMMMMNLYMGLAIIVTALLSQLSIMFVATGRKPFYGGVCFSVYTGLSALLTAKYLIGGSFRLISNGWLLVTGILCLVFGAIGTLLAKKILLYLVTYEYHPGS